jgi:diaminohydroxyphosphoribosylaminopyrimidine deaminase / 5-amino-6-(5-phosphoribosylamino)uracil reductase
VLVDSRLEVPEGARILAHGPLLIAAARADKAKTVALRARGAEVLLLPNAHGKVELAQLMLELGRRGVNELHVEAGTRLNGSLLREGCVDELLLYMAPSLIGDSGLGMFRLPEVSDLAQRIQLSIRDLGRVGEDVRVIARLRPV